MPAKVIPLAQQKTNIRALVNDALKDHPPHPCPEVVECVKSELEKILEKYFLDEAPELTLSLPEDLTREQFLQIRGNLDRAFTAHNEQLIERSNAIFRDLYLTKLEVCKLRFAQKHPDHQN